MKSGFSFKLDALRAGLPEKLAAQKAQPESGDQSLMKPLAAFLTDEISKLPMKFNGVLVIAHGELDREGGRILGQFQIYGKVL